MDTIGAIIKELTTCYKEQLKLYEQIREVGLQEKDLIGEGRFSVLLEVLQKKGRLMKEAAGYDTRIKEGQADLAHLFCLDAFSLPSLKNVVPADHRDNLAALEAVIADLVPVLERLEEQERSSEALLSEFLRTTEDPGVRRWRELRASRAYGGKKRG